MDKQTLIKGLMISFLIGDLTACANAPANFDIAKEAFDSGDYPTAYKQFNRLAAQGDERAEDYLGLMYLDGRGVTRDYVTAEHWLSLAADDGAPDAEFNLGNIYLAGLTGTQDYSRAMQLYRKAAAQGYAIAATNVGALYAAGFGVQQDYRQAMIWYEMGADGGDIRAMVGIGNMYLTGQGTEQNYAEAIRWLTKAAALKSPQAAEGLGYMQFYGFGEPKDESAAVKWYEAAADGGDFGAILFMASVYNQGGFGLVKDPVKAKALFERAADHEIVASAELAYELRGIIAAHKSYPDDALKAHIEGNVTVSFDLLDMRPTNIRVDESSGNHSLDKAAVLAVSNSLFPRRSQLLHQMTHFVVTLNFAPGSATPQPAAHQQCSQMSSCQDS